MVSRSKGRNSCWVLTQLCLFPAHAATVRLVLGLASKLASAGVFAVIYVYTTEIFPTPLRTIALGTSSTVARVGAIIASFIPLLVSFKYVSSSQVSTFSSTASVTCHCSGADLLRVLFAWDCWCGANFVVLFVRASVFCVWTREFRSSSELLYKLLIPREIF